MNSLQNLCELAGYSYKAQACCCIDAAYRKECVFAIVRCSLTTRYIFTDGRTLTVGVKTRYATFPRKSHLLDIAQEAMNELTEKHPRTKNRYVTENI